MNIIEVRNAAKLILPDDDGIKSMIINMFSYTSRTGECFANYIYKDGTIYLPPSMHKLEIVAGLLGKKIVDYRSNGEELSAPFLLSPDFLFRGYQEEPAKKLVAHVKANYAGTLSAACGGGKTIVMAYASGQLGNKTLVLIDQSNLITNWEIAYKIIYNKSLQIIKSNTTEFDDVCIATFQLLHKNPELLSLIKSKFGCVLVDEAHVVKATTFKHVMFRLDTKYRIGCSATFFAKNLSTGILEDLIAPVCVTMVDNDALTPTVRWVDTDVAWPSDNPNEFASCTLPYLAGSAKRTSVIFDILKQCLKEKRRTIVICIKVDQATLLEKIMTKHGARCVLYVGTTSAKKDKVIKELFESGQLDFVFASKKFDKGTDLPSADCIVMTRPNNNLKDTQQVTGRVVRKLNGKPKPIVYDFRDKGYLAELFANNRGKFYKQLKYEEEGVC